MKNIFMNAKGYDEQNIALKVKFTIEIPTYEVNGWTKHNEVSEHPLKINNIVFGNNAKMNLKPNKESKNDKTYRKEPQRTYPMLPTLMHNSTNLCLPNRLIMQLRSQSLCKKNTIIQWSETLGFNFIAKPSWSVV